MRGQIIKRGKSKNTYSVVVCLGRDAKGKYKRLWVSVKGTKRDAEKRLADILHQMDTGTFVRPDKGTVGEYLERWLKDCRPRLSPRAFERYGQVVNGHLIPDLGSIRLAQLRPEQIQKHETAMLERGLNAKTVRCHHSVIHSAMKQAVEWGLMSRNPVDAVRPPKIVRLDMQVWDEREIACFLEAVRRSAFSSTYHELFTLALFTGMRRSELLALRWQDVDLDLLRVSVSRTLHQLKDGRFVFGEPKSAKSRRTIALSPSMGLLLKDYRQRQALKAAELGAILKDSDLIFCHLLDGSPWRPNTVTRAWHTAAGRAGVKPIRLHDARHSHASVMLTLGVHPKVVQERLGHSTIAMTLDIYSHVAPGIQEAAAASFDAAMGRAEGPSAESDSKLIAKSVLGGQGSPN